MCNWNEPTPAEPGGCAEDVAVFGLLAVMVLMLVIIVGSLFSPAFGAWIDGIRLPGNW